MNTRVWARPDGTVVVTHFIIDDPEACARASRELVESGTIPPGSTFVDMPTAAFTALGLDRAKRHKWRARGGTVVVDNVVPDPPRPKQALRDAIDGAPSLAALKAVLRDALT